MKPNVDLTENSLFTTRDREYSQVEMLLIKAMKLNIPWKRIQYISTDSELGHMTTDSRKSSYFPTGTKQERQKIINARMFSRKICEDCGKNLSKCPWIRHKCTAFSMTLEKRIPWIF